MGNRNSTRLLALCFLTALGVIAFPAAAAQAQKLMILGSWAVSSESLQGTAATEFLLLVPLQALTIHCKETKMSEGSVLVSSTIHGTLSYKGCKTLQSGKEIAGCKPLEPITASVLGLTLLHESKTYILIEGSVSERFTTIKFNEETCALAPENEVKGSVVFECLNAEGASGNCSEELATHNIRPAPESLFPDSLRYGALGTSSAVLDGTLALSLSGGNAGCKFSVVI